MGTNQPSRGYGPLLVLLCIFIGVGVLALVVDAGSRLGRSATVLWGAIPIAVSLWQYAYSRIERHRLFVNRIRFWLTNPESAWGMTVEYDVADGAAALRAAAEAVKRSSPDARELSMGPDTNVWEFGGLPLRLAVDVADGAWAAAQAVLRVEFVSSPRAYRSWNRLIGDRVGALLEHVERDVGPNASKYAAHIEFPAKNPYFGLLLGHVDAQAVARVQVDFFEMHGGERDLVQIRKDRVTVVTTSAHAVKRLSLRYLTLQRPETET